MSRAEEIIQLHAKEESKAQNFRSLCQTVANLMYPSSNDITTLRTPGEDLYIDIRDPTGMTALDKATAGYIANWIPKDRLFFGIRILDRSLAELDAAKRWCTLATQIAHDELFSSNYMQQLQQSVKSLLCFGPCCSFSEFSPKLKSLNFKNWHISSYIFKENSRGIADCVSVKFSNFIEQFGRAILCNMDNCPERKLRGSAGKVTVGIYDFV